MAAKSSIDNSEPETNHLDDAGFSETGASEIKQASNHCYIMDCGMFIPGNIANHAHKWRRFTHDDWVLSQVRGVTIPFTGEPIQAKPPFPVQLNESEQIILTREVLSLSLSGGFTPCRHLRPSSGREHTIV